MDPAHAQAQTETSVSAARSFTVTTSLPGVHGPRTTGTHGCGVSAPSDAAVARATCGFAVERHIPKGRTFATGMKSCTVASGRAWSSTPCCGGTKRLAGAAPMLHWSVAPSTTSFGIETPCHNLQGA